MELRHLRYFQAVAEELHFGRAATLLNIAQPPLSQQIRNLEDELGVRLFERSSRRVELTEAGRIFLKRARVILDAAESAAQEARHVAGGQTSRIVVSFMSAAMLDQFVPILKAFRSEFPQADVQLQQLSPEEQLDALAAGHADVGFLDIPEGAGTIMRNERRLAARTAWREAFVAAVPPEHPLANRSRIALGELAGESFVGMPRRPAAGLHDQVIALCHAAGFSPRFRIEAPQLPATLALVAAGYGVAVVPACVCQPWEGLINFASLIGDPSIGVTMVWRPENESLVLAGFRAAAMAATPQLITKATDRAARVRTG